MTPTTQAELGGGLPPPWTKDDTEAFLTEFPLPASFTWPGKDGKALAVCPKYTLHGGYGKWLRETPYYPGLFDAVHTVLATDDAALGDEAVMLRALERARSERRDAHARAQAGTANAG